MVQVLTKRKSDEHPVIRSAYYLQGHFICWNFDPVYNNVSRAPPSAREDSSIPSVIGMQWSIKAALISSWTSAKQAAMFRVKVPPITSDDKDRR